MIEMTKKEFMEKCEKFGRDSEKFYVYWCTGGTAGSCWSDHLSSLGEDDPEDLTDLDDFLTTYFPNITFMQYKSIDKSVETTSYSEGDWYGGSANYISKTLKYEDLMTVLIRLDLLKILKEVKA